MSTKKNFVVCSVFLALLVLDHQNIQAAYSSDKNASQNKNAKMDQKEEEKAVVPVIISSPLCQKQHWSLSGQFLYWSTNYNFPFSLTELSNVVTMPPSSNPLETFQNTYMNTDIVRTNQKWSPGARVGLAYDSDCDRLDFQAFWTYYYNRDTKTLTSSMGQHIFVGAFEYVRGTLKVNYNVGDLELGRTYLLSPHVSVRPFVGVRGSWLRQHNFVQFDQNVSTFTVTTPTTGTVSVNQPLSIKLGFNLWGVGPRVGFNTNWGNFNGFSFLGNISAALLYGKNRTNLDLQNVSASQSSGNSGGVPVFSAVQVAYTDFKAHDRYWELWPNLQILMGFSWAHCFKRSGNVIKLSAGWETNFLWETTSLLFFDRSISFQGLTAELQFGF